MTPVATFNVYPERGKRLYFRVVIWRWLKDMRGHVCGLCRKAGEPHTYYADAHAVTLIHDNRRLEVAEIHFAMRHLSPYLVSHEVLHACIGWAQRVGLDLSDVNEEDAQSIETEERLCYAVGECSHAILDQVNLLPPSRRL